MRDQDAQGRDLAIELAGVRHVDGSARVQTVSPEQHPRWAGLLEAFEQQTGFPILLNTSLNVQGQPIVNTAAEAYDCLVLTGLDILVVEDLVLEREQQPAAAVVACQRWLAEAAMPQPTQPVPSAWRRGLSWLNRILHRLTWPLRWLVSQVALAMVYFGCVSPLGLLLWATGWFGRRDRNQATEDGSHWRRPPASDRRDALKSY